MIRVAAPVSRMFAALIMGGALLLTACTAAPPADPIAFMVRRDAGVSERLDAMEQAKRESPTNPKRVAALHNLVWDRGYPVAQRKLAIDQLIEHDEAAFVEALSRRIVLIENWDVLIYVLDLGVERRWPHFEATIVRNYARPATVYSDAERPERKALERLHPDKPVDEVVFEVFAREDESTDVKQQVAAWELLNRLSDSEKLIEYLARAPDSSPLVVDLKASARELHALPRTREGVLRLSYLRDPARSAFWQAAATRVAALSPQQRVGLDLRHLGALVNLDDRILKLDRAALASEVAQRLAATEHHTTSPTYDGGTPDRPQDLRTALDKLVWADLATIDMLTELLTDRDAAAALFKQADADLADKTTEFGGVIDYSRDAATTDAASGAGRGGRFVIRTYTPITRQHNLKFLPSQKMIDNVYTGIAHYHLHAQSENNSIYAGPGLGDLRNISRLEATGVVFTFIDHERLNMDYYQPGNVIVDIGTLHR